MIFDAVAATRASQTSGLPMVGWGLIAFVAGLGLVTNFRGLADNFAQRSRGSFGGRQSPLTVRLLAVPFVIAGPIAFVIGLRRISRGRIPIVSSASVPLASPFRYLVIAFAVAIVAWYWISPRGYFAWSGQRRGWRLALAVLASLGMLIFGVGIAFGQETIGIVALVAGGLPGVILLMNRKPAGQDRD